MKIGSNRDINRDRKKLPVVPKTDISVGRHDPVGVTRPHNLRMLTEKQNAEKVAITILIAYHYW